MSNEPARTLPRKLRRFGTGSALGLVMGIGVGAAIGVAVGMGVGAAVGAGVGVAVGFRSKRKKSES